MDGNYDARREAYSTAMKNMFKQIPTTMPKPIIPIQKIRKLMT